MNWPKNAERDKTEDAIKAFNVLKQRSQDAMIKRLEDNGIEYELDPNGNAVIRWTSFCSFDDFTALMNASKFKVIK